MIRHDTFTIWANYTDDLKTNKETKNSSQPLVRALRIT